MGIKQNMLEIIRDKIFDEDFYLKQYPDVAASGIDPLTHYIKLGWKEGRAPSGDNADVAPIVTDETPMQEDELISQAHLDRIPKINYALLGATDFCASLILEIQKLGLIMPRFILDDNINELNFADIPIKRISEFSAGSMPVVIASQQNANALRDKIIRKTKGFTKFTDLFSPDVSGAQKVFCIGYGKTGTTSTKAALEELGYILGNQPDAELLIFDWAEKDYSRIIEYCKTASAFQDIPFGCDWTFKALDEAFPDSKFVLTIRDSAEQWFDSMCRFHTKLFSDDKSATPTLDDFKQAEYRYKGYIYDAWLAYWEGSLYDKVKHTARYEKHNAAVKEYFANKPGQMLVINVAEEGAYAKLCEFLGKKPLRDEFPWKNKT